MFQANNNVVLHLPEESLNNFNSFLNLINNNLQTHAWMETQLLENTKQDVEKINVREWRNSCCSRQTRSWGSVWRPPLLSGCICPCTGACLGSWSGCFFLCSRWALCQTSEVGTAPRDAETSGAKGGEGGRRKGHETHQAVHQSVWPISVHFPD